MFFFLSSIHANLIFAENLSNIFKLSAKLWWELNAEFLPLLNILQINIGRRVLPLFPSLSLCTSLLFSSLCLFIFPLSFSFSIFIFSLSFLLYNSLFSLSLSSHYLSLLCKSISVCLSISLSLSLCFSLNFSLDAEFIPLLNILKINILRQYFSLSVSVFFCMSVCLSVTPVTNCL